MSPFRKSWTRLLMLCDCSHKSTFVRAHGADCPCPRTTGRGRNSRCGPDLSPGAFLERQCSCGDATPYTVHPDISEDREGSTSAVPCLSGRYSCCVPRRIQSQSNSLDSRRNLGHPGNLENFLVRRARVRDDPGRSPQIELEPERSF